MAHMLPTISRVFRLGMLMLNNRRVEPPSKPPYPFPSQRRSKKILHRLGELVGDPAIYVGSSLSKKATTVKQYSSLGPTGTQIENPRAQVS